MVLKMPTPPLFESKQANHYWLDIFDCDGHYFGRVILQWAPGAKKWCHSGNLGTDIYVPVSEHWKLVCKQEMPD
jgi:hypothetical protein